MDNNHVSMNSIQILPSYKANISHDNVPIYPSALEAEKSSNEKDNEILCKKPRSFFSWHTLGNNQMADHEREMRKENMRKSKLKVICCLKKTVAVLFSHIGLTGMVVVYSIAGGFLFEWLEVTNELKDKFEYSKYKTDYIFKIIEFINRTRSICNATLNPSELNKTENFLQRILENFQEKVAGTVKSKGWDGKDNLDEVQWSFAGSLLFAVTVITTIGYGHIAPRTWQGQILTILYAMAGIPLTFLFLSNIGNVMADALKKICCGVCCCLQCKRRKDREILRLRRKKKLLTARNALLEKNKADDLSTKHNEYESTKYFNITDPETEKDKSNYRDDNISNCEENFVSSNNYHLHKNFDHLDHTGIKVHRNKKSNDSYNISNENISGFTFENNETLDQKSSFKNSNNINNKINFDLPLLSDTIKPLSPKEYQKSLSTSHAYHKQNQYDKYIKNQDCSNHDNTCNTCNKNNKIIIPPTITFNDEEIFYSLKYSKETDLLSNPIDFLDKYNNSENGIRETDILDSDLETSLEKHIKSDYRIREADILDCDLGTNSDKKTIAVSSYNRSHSNCTAINEKKKYSYFRSISAEQRLRQNVENLIYGEYSEIAYNNVNDEKRFLFKVEKKDKSTENSLINYRKNEINNLNFNFNETNIFKKETLKKKRYSKTDDDIIFKTKKKENNFQNDTCESNSTKCRFNKYNLKNIEGKFENGKPKISDELNINELITDEEFENNSNSSNTNSNELYIEGLAELLLNYEKKKNILKNSNNIYKLQRTNTMPLSYIYKKDKYKSKMKFIKELDNFTTKTSITNNNVDWGKNRLKLPIFNKSISRNNSSSGSFKSTISDILTTSIENKENKSITKLNSLENNYCDTFKSSNDNILQEKNENIKGVSFASINDLLNNDVLLKASPCTFYVDRSQDVFTSDLTITTDLYLDELSLELDDDDEDLDIRDHKVNVPIFVCLIIIASYILAGSALFSRWENWDYITSSYFCFITLSTIGFGDIVPGTGLEQWASHEKLFLCAIWLAFGLSLIAMCFNLMQEEVKEKFKCLGQKLGFLQNEKES